jgi:hypothetical protein
VEYLQPRNVIENVEKLLFLNSLEKKFLRKKFPWKKYSSETNFLGKKIPRKKVSLEGDSLECDSSEKKFLVNR